MAPSDSFDPRTWQGDDPAPVTIATAAPPRATRAPPPSPSTARWLGPALSAAILLGGAFAAYSTRIEGPAAGADSSTR